MWVAFFAAFRTPVARADDADDVAAAVKFAGDAASRLDLVRDAVDNDRWLVAWWLAATSSPELARSWVDAVSGGRALLARVAEWIGTIDPATRDLVRAAAIAQGSSDWPALLAAVDRVDPKGDAFLRAWKLVRHGAGKLMLGDATGTRELEEGARVAEDLGWVEGASRAWSSLAQRRFSVDHDYAASLVLFERSHTVLAAAGLAVQAAIDESNLAPVRAYLGDARRALEHFDRALRPLKNARHWAFPRVANNASLIATRYGALARALNYADEARDAAERAHQAADVAYAFARAAAARWRCGDLQGAERDGARALEHFKQGRDPDGFAEVMTILGGVAWAKGDVETALARMEEVRAACRVAKDDEAEAIAAEWCGEILHAMGRNLEALEALAGAETTAERLRRPALVADVLRERAAIRAKDGHAVEVGPLLDRARVLAEEADDLPLQVRILEAHARLRLGAGDTALAITDARTACERAAALSRGLADVQSSSARSTHAGVHEVGAAAALRRQDADALLYFLEAGRGGALLETIESRDAFRIARVDATLRKREDDAATEAAIASRTYQDALETGELGKIRAARTSLDAARARVRDASARIDREGRLAASALTPPSATVAWLAAKLQPSDAFVAYGDAEGHVAAIVIRTSGARVVDLGASSEIEKAVDAFRDAVNGGNPIAAMVDPIRRQLITPLGLPADVSRVILSPDARLSLLPWALLAPGRDVACVPSGAVWAVLAARGLAAGKGVLALGDPVYAKGARGLPPLPATREEVQAIGDVILLGADATEPRLKKALTERPRWSAIHLACHGLPDARIPEECALALTRSEGDDGRLTSLEVLATPISTDLVVLSACESGIGASERGEGAMSLARAFMAAGAPRVICSLWKVDDEATRALMTKFYEGWRRNDAKPGVSASASLRQAQQFVSAQEKWKDPRFWAGWVLWGLIDG